MWGGIWHYTQTLGCRERRIDVAVLATSAFDTTKSSSTSWVHLHHRRVVTYNPDISGCQNYRECAVQCSGCMLDRQSTVGVCRANIDDQSRARETRMCLFLYYYIASESTSVLMYVLIKVRAVLFLYYKNQRAVHHFQVTLIADGPHHYHPACGHKGSSHLSPVHALQFFYRDASLALLQLINQ